MRSTKCCKTFEVPVIFITAYPERFLTGERPEPAFLIAKPFQPATVSAVIEPGAVLRTQGQAAAAPRLGLRRPSSAAADQAAATVSSARLRGSTPHAQTRTICTIKSPIIKPMTPGNL